MKEGSIVMDGVINREKTLEEHRYTSTGIKFWRHRESLTSYKEGGANTVISTHISPEGSCNLSCPYCSVSKRLRNSRIELSVIQDYVIKLKKHGLRAVILTGGGEPTLYPQFNELVRWLKEKQNLSVALITNGTKTDLVDNSVWDMFSWVRISLNFFEHYQEKIKFPKLQNGVLGASMVYTEQTLAEIKSLSKFVPQHVTYVRVLPNCLLSQELLLKQHEKLELLLHELNDSRFFHQFKIHSAPCSEICHQSYFRPYLSEVDGGTVFPCDSLVLNDEQKHFGSSYAICKAEDIEKFLNREIQLKFDARKVCTGCVFTDNIYLLDQWVKYGKNEFDSYMEEMTHEEFV